MGDEKQSGGVTIGNVNGGITGSIIAGGDVNTESSKCPIPSEQKTIATALDPDDRAHLRQFLTQWFNLDELKSLASDLGVGYDEVPHETREELSRELIAYFERRGKLNELVSQVRHQRYDADLERRFARLPGSPSTEEWSSVLQGVYTPSKPFQAPPEIPHFVGRQKEITWLEKQIDQGSRIIGLCGLGGVGKTALAIHVAHALRDRFEGGVLWASLNATTPEAALSSFATGFGQAESVGKLSNLADKASQVRSILADKNVLVVLDNVEGSEQIEWLVPSGKRNITLVTTRNRKMLLTRGAELLDMELFSEIDGLALLTQVISSARVLADLEAAKQVIKSVGGLPLALSIVAGYLAEENSRTITKSNELLKDERERLEHLDDWADTTKNVKASFELSYSHLTEVTQRLFAALSTFDGPDFGVEAVAAAANLPMVVAEQGVGKLRSLSLVEIAVEEQDSTFLGTLASQGRYRLHPLIKPFARKKLDSEPNTVRQRAAAYFSDLAQKHGKDGYRFLDLDWENIVGALKWAYDENRQWRMLVEGVQGLTLMNLGVVGFMDARGHWNEAREILSWALKGAEALDDTLARASVLTKLGAFAFRQAEYETAERYLQESLSFLDRLPSSSKVLLQRAQLYEFMSRLVMERDCQAALGWAQRGLAELTSEETSDAMYQRGCLHILRSTILGRMGNWKEAADAAEEGLALLPPSPSSARIAWLTNLSNIMAHSGEHEKRVEYLQQGIKLAGELADLRRLADLQRNMGAAMEESKHPATAIGHYQLAIQLYQRMGSAEQEGHVHSNLGLSYILKEDYEQAESHLTTAIRIAETRRSLDLKVFAETNLARLQILQGKFVDARTNLSRAYAICCLDRGLSELPEVLRSQAQIALSSGDHDAALTLIEESLRVAKEDSYVLAEGVSWRVKGDILNVMGNLNPALEAYLTSVRILQEQDPYELAESKLALAQCYLQTKLEVPAAKHLLDESLAVFEKFEAKRKVERIKGLLEQVA